MPAPAQVNLPACLQSPEDLIGDTDLGPGCLEPVTTGTTLRQSPSGPSGTVYQHVLGAVESQALLQDPSERDHVAFPTGEPNPFSIAAPGNVWRNIDHLDGAHLAPTLVVSDSPPEQRSSAPPPGRNVFAICSGGRTLFPAVNSRQVDVVDYKSRIDFIQQAAYATQGYTAAETDLFLRNYYKDRRSGSQHDPHWYAFVRFLRGRQETPRCLDVTDVVRYLNQIDPSSVKFASTSICMTYQFAFNIDLNEYIGLRGKSVRKAAAAARSPRGRSLADITALDPQVLTSPMSQQAPLTDLDDQPLRDCTMALLATRAGLRPSDLYCMPGGSTKFVQDPDGEPGSMIAKVAIYNGKNAGSKGGVARNGWTRFVEIYPLRVDRVSLICGDADKAKAIVLRACTVRALQEMDRRLNLQKEAGLLLPGYPTSLGGRVCLSPSTFMCTTKPERLKPPSISNILKRRIMNGSELLIGRAAGADMEVYHLRHSTAVNLEMVGCTASREQRLTQENPDAMWRNHYGLLQQNPAFKIRLTTLKQKLSTEDYELLNADERLLI